MIYRLNANEITAPPPSFPPHRTLSGRFVTLLPLEDDARFFQQLYECSHGDVTNERVWDYMPYGPFADSAAMGECYAEMAVGGDPQFYAVRHNASGICAGIVSYLRIHPGAYSIEIGHIWHSARFHRGYANTESTYLLMDGAFSLGYRRLEWKCNALNNKSRQAALRMGLGYEGIFRQHTAFKGKNRDTAWFALLDKDWPQVKQNFNRWLSEDKNRCSLTALNRPVVEWSLAAHDQYLPESN